MLQNKKVLVTGGAGFIGSNLTEELLRNNNQVICLDNFSTGHEKNLAGFINHRNFCLIEGDIRSYETCKIAAEGVDYVYHQAALGSVPRSINDPLITNEVNVSGFINMLQAAKEAKVKRFIYAASSSTYGDHPALPKVEEEIGSPLSPYAVTKYVNELYAQVFSKTYGIETIGLRYFNVFGKRQDPDGAYAAVIPKFVKSFILKESPVINGDGAHSRDFTYVENVVQANLLAAATENPTAINKVYNVAFGSQTSLKELVENLKALLSAYDPEISKVKVKYGPDRIGDIKHSLASIEKAKSLLGYNPKFSVIEGLQASVEWYFNSLKKELVEKG